MQKATAPTSDEAAHQSVFLDRDLESGHATRSETAGRIFLRAAKRYQPYPMTDQMQHRNETVRKTDHSSMLLLTFAGTYYLPLTGAYA
jgi:hypothetical protein